MSITVVYSPRFLEHDMGAGHPEQPQRVAVCAAYLKAAGFHEQLHWLPPRMATTEELSWVHSPSYIELIQALAQRGGGRLDADTYVGSASYEIALLSAGGWLVGVDQVVDQRTPTFVLARPPGHHAEKQRGMGFCLFSNAALAAQYALRVKGLSRVAIFDWDVHHGNGTQSIVEQDPRIAYCSIHEAGNYPGTGDRSEEGAYQNVLNLPLAARSGKLEYLTAFDQEIHPFLERFQPQLLIISAGFDANRTDPLANMALEPEDFGTLTERCLAITPHLLLGLEGGYDLEALGNSVVSVVAALVGNTQQKQNQE
jgi:acetoin utilization deacetylase AcuC-like enzyme